jgi:hypothetical protein
VWAQAELIVKIRGDSTESAGLLRSAIGKGSTDLANASNRLASVQAVEPVFASTRTTSKRAEHGLGLVFRLSMPDSTALLQARAEWAADPDVEYAVFNHQYRLDVVASPTGEADYSDTHFDSLTHLSLIRAPEAWTVTRGDASVRIGVIDTGVFKEHPDLRGQFWINQPEDLNGNGRLDDEDLNGIDDDQNGYIDDVVGYDFVDRSRAVDAGDYLVRDPDASEDLLSPAAPRRGGFGHGTLVSGIVSAALDNGEGIAGVAPGARLVPIRAFGIDGLGEDDDVSAAIVYAADLGLDVVNLSFGDSYYSPLMADAIRYATSQGTTVVASGGNSGSDAPHYPSDYPESIGALWLDRAGEGRGSLASYGIGIDVGAPGSFVYTTVLPPPEGLAGDLTPDSVLYGYRSGSSAAAPQVTGGVALLRSLDRSLSPASIKAILTATAVDLDEPGWDHQTASGRLDLAAALNLPYAASVTIATPRHEAGIAGEVLEITGTVVSSLFESYSVSYGFETPGREPEWTPIAEQVTVQKRDDVLATWNLAALPDSTYILRLNANLRNGQTIEDRRRLFVDRTPPEVDIILADYALNGPHGGVQVELISDDASSAEMTVSIPGASYTVSSDRSAFRHGHSLVWSDGQGLGEEVMVEVRIENKSGLSSTVGPFPISVLGMPNPGLLKETPTDLPAGYLLPEATDLDRDGLKELVFNRYREGWLGDTLSVAEWSGSGFARSLDLLANSFPRSLGDTDGDGDPEILLQVSATTQVLEFRSATGEIEMVFLDTTGIADPSSPEAAWGTLLTDLDGDGWGEVVTHNRKAWRLFEYRPGGFELVATLENPTPIEEADPSGLLGSEANGFAEPQAAAGDFDGDGLGDLLVTDTDGDFIVYEATGDDTYEPVWFHLTPRFSNQGSRMTTGDFDGDGLQEFAAFTHNWPDQRLNGEYDAPYGLYHVFESDGDNRYRTVDSLIVVGLISNHGSLAAVDFDVDGADELVVAHPPDLYVLKPDEQHRWRILFHRGDLGREVVSGIRSIAMTPADFDRDGFPELVVAGAETELIRFEWSASGSRLPPPAWTQGVALNANEVELTWRGGEADSFAVYRRMDESDFDLLATTSSSRFVDPVSALSTYALIGYYDGEPSALSSEITVRPHDPATLVASEWRKGFVAFTFTESLPPTIEPSAITLAGGQAAETAITANGGTELLLAFEPLASPGDSVFWPQLTDSEGTPLKTQSAVIPDYPASSPGLFLTEWEAVTTSRARLSFNFPLEANEAKRLSNYRVDPEGEVVSAQFDPVQPTEVVLDVSGRALGPTGLRTSIVVTQMLAANGSTLAPEGNVATFVESAESLADAYIFPNPFRADQHRPEIVIAGLPNRSTIEIFSPTGTQIKTLEERDGDGGLVWDLTDIDGASVGSGVYIIRIETESEESIILKSAIIR